MKVYNTLGRQLQEFKPLKEGRVSLYTCGPTVYDYPQIGNLRAFVFDDTLRRYLQTTHEVKHVMNITDVGHLVSDEDEGEDKLEKGAGREHKTVWEVADFYIKAFLDDVKQLNILQPNAYHSPHGNYARATDFIPQQLAIVKILIDKGFAYITEQAIYFDVTKLDDYGKLTGQKLSDKEVAARSEVVTDPAKQNPHDFALWFFTVGRFAEHSMHWSSQWGEGFPGWHLECSAIIHATLGEPIDIHTGGVDHIGTHHTNEIAQTEAAFGVELAHYWMHNEHLLVDGQKMSKSKGNFITLKDVTDKGYDPLALRLLFLQAHYRSQMNFSWEALDSAQARLKTLKAFGALKWQVVAGSHGETKSADAGAIRAAMADDLNTPLALAALSGYIALSLDNGIYESNKDEYLEILGLADEYFGLSLAGQADISDGQKTLIGKREAAREAKDWQTADKLRAELQKQGVEINDTPAGPLWRRLN